MMMREGRLRCVYVSARCPHTMSSWVFGMELTTIKDGKITNFKGRTTYIANLPWFEFHCCDDE